MSRRFGKGHIHQHEQAGRINHDHILVFHARWIADVHNLLQAPQLEGQARRHHESAEDRSRTVRQQQQRTSPPGQDAVGQGRRQPAALAKQAGQETGDQPAGPDGHKPEILAQRDYRGRRDGRQQHHRAPKRGGFVPAQPRGKHQQRRDQGHAIERRGQRLQGRLHAQHKVRGHLRQLAAEQHQRPGEHFPGEQQRLFGRINVATHMKHPGAGGRINNPPQNNDQQRRQNRQRAPADGPRLQDQRVGENEGQRGGTAFIGENG